MPGFPSLKPPVEKVRKEKENPAGAHPPGGSRQYVGGSAPPIPPSRRQGRNGLFSLPQMRAPSGSPASARPSRTRRQTGCPSILVEEVRAAPRAQIARDAGARLKSSRKPSRGPRPGHRAGGQRPGQERVRAGKAARRSPADLASRLWTGTEARRRPW